MGFKLVVVRPFGGYKVGTVVTDPKSMLAIEQGEHVDHVVRAAVTAAPAMVPPAGSAASMTAMSSTKEA